MDGISPHLQKLWEEWEMRAVILLSLTIQVLLIVLGHQRKYRPDFWLKALVWSCYLTADAVAISALGKIATRLNQMRRDLSAATVGLDPNTQMTAFWAPFLLLHLGGPDTITAYALEDNELWLRHLLRLVVQMAGTLLIFFQALTGSDLSVLSLFMIVSGLIKYGERVYVLRAVSSEQFRDSIRDPPLCNLKILEEFKLKEAEGYEVTPHEVIEVCGAISEYNSNEDGDLSSPDEALFSNEAVSELKKKRAQGGEKSNCGQSLLAAARGPLRFFGRLFGDEKLLPNAMSERNRTELAIANELIAIFSRLFVDLVLGSQDRNTGLLILKDKHFHVVFRVIEIELGLMYDLLYTKARAIDNIWGCTLRVVSILLTCLVLVLFSLSDRDKYNKVNIYMTFLLLWVAIFQEIYALFVLLFSDKAAIWLKNNSPRILDFAERLQPLYERRRWSGSLAQFNLLSFALQEKHVTFHRMLKLLKIKEEKVLEFLHKSNVEITDFLKEQVIEHVKSQVTCEKEVPSVWTYRGHLILRRHELLDNFKWSIDLEFDQSILVWHIATELLCHRDYEHRLREDISSNYEMSKQLSQYMLYLLVMYPFLLPIGVGRSKFRDTCAEVISFLKGEPSKETDPLNKGEPSKETDPPKSRPDPFSAFGDALDKQLAKILANGEKSKFTLYHGCQLASQLNDEIYDQEKKWNLLSFVWVEMLAYAAVKCNGHQHAGQLRRGGEFLTHVWLLMAQFGLTDHFQTQHAPAIADLLVKPK